MQVMARWQSALHLHSCSSHLRQRLGDGPGAGRRRRARLGERRPATRRKSIAAIPLGNLAPWSYHEVMAGHLVTVSAMPPLLLRSASAGWQAGGQGRLTSLTTGWNRSRTSFGLV